MGRDALLKQKAEGLPKRFVPMIVDCDFAHAHNGDPIYAGDALIGVVTSAAYGHTIDKNIAMGFVDAEYAEVGTQLEVGIIGQRYTAVTTSEPIFDPKHLRPRA